MIQAQRWKPRPVMAARRCLPTLLVGVLAVAVGVVGVRAARAADNAPDPDVVARVMALNHEAVERYERGDFEEARALLRRALALCAAPELLRHPAHALTVLHMGVVLVGGLAQRQAGIVQFRKALEIHPDITLTRTVASPDLQAAFDEAARTMANAGSEQIAADAAAISALMHTSVSEGKRGSAISITVGVQDALKFSKLILAYRGGAATQFLGRPLQPVGSGSYTAEIPSTATTGAQVAYYIEALDGSGKVVAARGSAEAPLVIALDGSARSGLPIRDEADEGPDSGGSTGRAFVALTWGSGLGIASGTGDLNADVMTSHAQLAVARVIHLSPEVGFWVNRSLLISLQARIQLVGGTTDLIIEGRRHRAAGAAGALFARAGWLFRPRADLHPLFSLFLGAGQIRHVVALGFSDCGDDQHQRCLDTITAGPVLAGAGSGFMLSLTERLFVLVQLNAQIAAPRSTLNLDGNLGMAARF